MSAEITGSHEEFWTFSQVSQWGSPWPYTNEAHLNKVRSCVITTRAHGLKWNKSPREIHIAQALIWRFYLRKQDTEKYPYKDIMLCAYACAAQSLENQMAHKTDTTLQTGDGGKMQFEFMQALNFHLKISHPSEYLKEFITPEFTGKQLDLAECIISDSFLCPCCLVYKPRNIAEGAAIMAAGMTGNPNSVIPKETKTIAFIRDMSVMYRNTLSRARDPAHGDGAKLP